MAGTLSAVGVADGASVGSTTFGMVMELQKAVWTFSMQVSTLSAELQAEGVSLGRLDPSTQAPETCW